MTKLRYLATNTILALSLAAVACGGKDDDESADPDQGADQTLGDTAIVAVVNPVENEGNTADIPNAVGTERAGIPVAASPGGAATTDDTGLAVLDEVAAGELTLTLGGAPAVPFSLAEEGDVCDVAIAYDGEAAEVYPNFPICYGVGGTVLDFDETAQQGDLATALDTDDTIVYLRSGRYVGDLTITGENVLFFGEGFAERDVVIEGNVTVMGGGVRVRGFTITGDLTVNGNTFGMAYSIVRGTTDIRGNAVAFLRNTFCGSVTVPSSNASLLDNHGMAPLDETTAEECPPPP